jgi:hypothetical protein
MLRSEILSTPASDIQVLLHNGGFGNNCTQKKKTVLAHIGAFSNKGTIEQTFHTKAA